MNLIKLWTVSIVAAVVSALLLPIAVNAILNQLDPASPSLLISGLSQIIQPHSQGIILAALLVPLAFIAGYAILETGRRLIRQVIA
jgi:hypothetical protein